MLRMREVTSSLTGVVVVGGLAAGNTLTEAEAAAARARIPTPILIRALPTASEAEPDAQLHALT